MDLILMKTIYNIIFLFHGFLFVLFIFIFIMLLPYLIYLIIKHIILYKYIPNSITKFMRLYYYVNIDKLNTNEKYKKLSYLLKFQSDHKFQQLILFFTAVFSGLIYMLFIVMYHN